MSFLGSSDRWKYLQRATGLGSTTPAVYTACHTSVRLTRRVTSLISTGASRFVLMSSSHEASVHSHANRK